MHNRNENSFQRGASFTALHVNFIPFVWLSFWDFFFSPPPVYLLPPSFLISQRSPRLFSDDQVPENVEQRACQLAALLEPRPAARHQVTTAPLSVCCTSGSVWVPLASGVTQVEELTEIQGPLLHTVLWIKTEEQVYFVSYFLLDLTAPTSLLDECFCFTKQCNQ